MKYLRSLILFLTAIACAGDSSADQYVHQWVGSSGDGVVTGRIVTPGKYGASVAVPDSAVTLSSMERNEFFAETTSDATGHFRFSDVPLGVYVLKAQTESTFACGVLHVIDDETAQGVMSVEIPAANLDRVTVQTAIMRYLSAYWKNDLRNSLPNESLVFNGTPLRVATVGNGLNGRMMKDPWTGAADTNVFLFVNGEEVARTITDGDGWFRVERLKPGTYAILGIGRHGLAASGLELIDTETLTTVVAQTPEERELIAQAQDAAPAFALQLAPPIVVTEFPDEEDDEIVYSEPLVNSVEVPTTVEMTGYTPQVGGDFAPIGGGNVGGGGFTGGGGLGDLSSLTTAGAMFVILASDDDGINASNPPSPIVP